MPVRSLRSSVLRWPDRDAVEAAVRDWACREASGRADLLRLGYFGSYARGDWGVGSDLDLVAVVRESREPFERRGLGWELDGLPVPAEIVVYTEGEWDALVRSGSRFARTVAEEGVWVWRRDADA